MTEKKNSAAETKHTHFDTPIPPTHKGEEVVIPKVVPHLPDKEKEPEEKKASEEKTTEQKDSEQRAKRRLEIDKELAAILKQHNGNFSDIPPTSKFWGLQSEYKALL